MVRQQLQHACAFIAQHQHQQQQQQQSNNKRSMVPCWTLATSKQTSKQKQHCNKKSSGWPWVSRAPCERPCFGDERDFCFTLFCRSQTRTAHFSNLRASMKTIVLCMCLGFAAAGFFSSSKVDTVDDLSGCGEMLPKSFRMSKYGFTVSCPECEDGKVKAKVSYDPGRWLPTIDLADASADIELTDNGDSVTIDYENLDLGPLNHHVLNEYDWLNMSKGSYTFDKFAKGKDTLKLKEKLEAGDTLVSKNRFFQLEMQEDGNLVLTEAAVMNFTLWESGTAGGPGKAVLESNGDFVIYNKKNKNVWHSDTADQKVSMLKLRNDGNIVLYSGSDSVWQSGETCCECDEDAEVTESTMSHSRSYLDRVKSFFKSSDDDDDDEQEEEEEEQEKKTKKEKEEIDEDEEEEKKKIESKKKKAKKAEDKKAKDKKAKKEKEAKEKKNKKDDKKSTLSKKASSAVKGYMKKKAKQYFIDDDEEF